MKIQSRQLLTKLIKIFVNQKTETNAEIYVADASE